jgi:hypothetical protein
VEKYVSRKASRRQFAIVSALFLLFFFSFAKSVNAVSKIDSHSHQVTVGPLHENVPGDNDNVGGVKYPVYFTIDHGNVIENRIEKRRESDELRLASSKLESGTWKYWLYQLFKVKKH